MGPIFQRLSQDNPVAGARFVELDLTDDIAIAISQEVAAGHGVDDIFRYNRRTGLVIVIDADDFRRLDKLDITMTEEEMRTRIASSVKRARAGN